MSYTKIAKPINSNYTKIGKPTNGFVIPSGTATGLLTPPTHATAYTFGNSYTKIAKPNSQNLLTNGNFRGSSQGWILNNFSYNNNNVLANGNNGSLSTDDGIFTVEKVQNPNFVDQNHWTLGAGWSYGANNVTWTGPTIGNLTQNIGMITGQQYSVIINLTISSGSLGFYWGGASHVLLSFSGDNLTTQTAEGDTITLIPSSDFIGTINSISVKGNGTDYRFSLSPVPYKISLFVSGSVGEVELIIYGNLDFQLDEIISANSGQVSYNFTPTRNDTSCYVEIDSLNGFNSTITNIFLTPTPNYTNILKPT